MRSPREAARKWEDWAWTTAAIDGYAAALDGYTLALNSGRWGARLDPERSIAVLKERYVDGVYTIEQFEEYVGQVLARAAV